MLILNEICLVYVWVDNGEEPCRMGVGMEDSLVSMIYWLQNQAIQWHVDICIVNTGSLKPCKSKVKLNDYKS